MGKSSEKTRRKRVLLAEDSTITQDILRFALEGRGHKLKIAGTVADALALLIKNPFDIALIDFQLPDGNGLELVETLITRYGDKPLPRLVALTGNADEVHAMQVNGAIFDLILAKPFVIADLVFVVEAAESKARFRRRDAVRGIEQVAIQPLLNDPHDYHLIYYPYNFYSSFRNAVSMSVAQRGAVDAIVMDVVPHASDRQLLSSLKGLGAAAFIDRTGAFGYQCHYALEAIPEENNRIRRLLDERRKIRNSFAPGATLSREVGVNLLMQMVLGKVDLKPKLDYSDALGIAYNHILDATHIIEAAGVLALKGYVQIKDNNTANRCPYCASSRLFLTRPDGMSVDPSRLQCLDCLQGFSFSEVRCEPMRQFSITALGRQLVFGTFSAEVA